MCYKDYSLCCSDLCMPLKHKFLQKLFPYKMVHVCYLTTNVFASLPACSFSLIRFRNRSEHLFTAHVMELQLHSITCSFKCLLHVYMEREWSLLNIAKHNEPSQMTCIYGTVTVNVTEYCLCPDCQFMACCQLEKCSQLCVGNMIDCYSYIFFWCGGPAQAGW